MAKIVLVPVWEIIDRHEGAQERGQLVVAAMQDGIAQPRFIAHPVRGQGNPERIKGFCQAAAFQSFPHPFILQACCVAAGNHRIAAVKMIAMCLRQVGDHNLTGFFVGGGGFRETRELLQDRQRFELQRVQSERILFRCHTKRVSNLGRSINRGQTIVVRKISFRSFDG